MPTPSLYSPTAQDSAGGGPEYSRVMRGQKGSFSGLISAISTSRNVPEGQYLALGIVPKKYSKLGTEFKVELNDGSFARAVVDKYNPLPKFMKNEEDAPQMSSDQYDDLVIALPK